MAWFSGRLNDLFARMRGFSWRGGAKQDPPAKGSNVRPGDVDMTGGLPSNSELLKALCEGTYKGLEFAAPLTLPPLATIVALMGIPVPKSDDPRTQEALDGITAQMKTKFGKLHRRSLLHGTAWRFPRYDREYGLVWEEIPDVIVTDIIVDITSNRVKEIYTSEQISIRKKVAVNETVQRDRHFTPDRVAVKYNIGRYPDYTARNVAGVLPVPFANETDESEIRGQSLFGRVLHDLKDYHDTDYRVSTILAKFTPKMIQTVSEPGDWLNNNKGTRDLAAFKTVNIFETDLIVNVKDKESTDFVFAPSDATAAHENALRRKFLKIVEGTGIPEIFWGPLATGNHATTEEQWQQAINRVEEIRLQYAEAYRTLYRGSLNVLQVANAETYAGDVEITWNRLSSVSENTRADILRGFGTAVSSMMNSGTMTLRQLYTLWNQMNPESGIGTLEEFKAELKECATYMHFVKDDPLMEADRLNAEGGESDDE